MILFLNYLAKDQIIQKAFKLKSPLGDFSLKYFKAILLE